MDSIILPVDNLYILDVDNNKASISVLEYFNANIQKYNQLARRKVRIFRITTDMIKAGTVLKGLEQKGIKTLPTLELFKPVHQAFSGAPEIIAFVETLFRKTIELRQYRQRSQQPHIEGPPLLDDTNKLYSDFYRDEIIGKENEENIGANMSSQISDRYRTALERRSGKRSAIEDDDTLEDAPPPRRAPSNMGDGALLGDDLGGGEPPPPPQQDNIRHDPTEDSVMSSVRKAAQGAGADADLEISLFQNKFEITQT
jgi:hypothetical protein